VIASSTHKIRRGPPYYAAFLETDHSDDLSLKDTDIYLFDESIYYYNQGARVSFEFKHDASSIMSDHTTNPTMNTSTYLIT
jgi:hypothetical protein